MRNCKSIAHLFMSNFWWEHDQWSLHMTCRQAVNPHAKNEEGTETPEELLDFIAMKGQDGATPLQSPLSACRQRGDRRCEHRRTIPEKATTDVLKSRLPSKPLTTSPR
jgi:hypothetical protein